MTAMHATGFEPLAAPGAKVLVLGTLPGQESLRRGEYYAHPRNSFWRIVEILFGIPAESPYSDRVRRLGDAGVALWDVCAAANRPGSLDLAIRHDSVVPNDFAAFLQAHPQVKLICFNGAKAAALFRKHVKLDGEIRCIDLPSTSPAHAAMSLPEKVKRWSVIRDECGVDQVVTCHQGGPLE
jgi:double-stranded uracil-DNA glycosylase